MCTFKASCYSPFVVGTSSDINKKRCVWVRERIGFLAMTFTSKEHYHPVFTVVTRL